MISELLLFFIFVVDMLYIDAVCLYLPCD